LDQIIDMEHEKKLFWRFFRALTYRKTGSAY
ncbi:MAG: hypothetical protein ACJA04_000974, partial [Cellvibrionaceae bacterium]